MDIIRDVDATSASELGSHAVSIGAYDGVHHGHQAVIGECQRHAAELGIKSAVVTFDPHPAYVIRPESAPKLLTDLETKMQLLEAAGVDTVVVLRFDEVAASETPAEFVERVLVNVLGAKSIVVGHDFHFGKGRAGNVEVLRELGLTFGFEVHGLQLLPRPDGNTEPVSSTAIRRALAGGEVAIAAGMLGRYHSIRGVVVDGDQRGRTIGFPTANVAVPTDMARPADAVYACWYVRPDGSRHAAAVNVGRRPTFYQDAEHSLVEAHLIDFAGELYGEEAVVEFVDLLRSEQRFDGIDALKSQLMLDIEHARAVLQNPLWKG